MFVFIWKMMHMLWLIDILLLIMYIFIYIEKYRYILKWINRQSFSVSFQRLANSQQLGKSYQCVSCANVGGLINRIPGVRNVNLLIKSHGASIALRFTHESWFGYPITCNSTTNFLVWISNHIHLNHKFRQRPNLNLRFLTNQSLLFISFQNSIFNGRHCVTDALDILI